MSKYSLPKLLKLWELAELTIEQVIGQILQHFLAQDKEILTLTDSVAGGRLKR